MTAPRIETRNDGYTDRVEGSVLLLEYWSEAADARFAADGGTPPLTEQAIFGPTAWEAAKDWIRTRVERDTPADLPWLDAFLGTVDPTVTSATIPIPSGRLVLRARAYITRMAVQS